MSDNKYASDDSHIYKLLFKHNIPINIIFDVISLVNNVRRDNRYIYLNLNYLTVASYALVSNNMQIDEQYIYTLEKLMIKSNDDIISCKALTRYCRYIIKSYDIL